MSKKHVSFSLDCVTAMTRGLSTTGCSMKAMLLRVAVKSKKLFSLQVLLVRMEGHVSTSSKWGRLLMVCSENFLYPVNLHWLPCVSFHDCGYVSVCCLGYLWVYFRSNSVWIYILYIYGSPSYGRNTTVPDNIALYDLISHSSYIQLYFLTGYYLTYTDDLTNCNSSGVVY